MPTDKCAENLLPKGRFIGTIILPFAGYTELIAILTGLRLVDSFWRFFTLVMAHCTPFRRSRSFFAISQQRKDSLSRLTCVLAIADLCEEAGMKRMSRLSSKVGWLTAY